MITTLYGDALAQLATLPPESVQCCVTSPPYWGLRSYLPKNHPLKPLEIGREKTPQEYVEKLVAVFRELRRVLRKDGTLWLNLGDSYARNGGTQGGGNRELMHLEGVQSRMCSIPCGSGLKPKDLIGIPWRVAFSLQADGWWLRQDLIWAKPNPMPESVTDRCTKAHEYVFLLSKSAKYYYDAEAIKEKMADSSLSRLKQDIQSQAGSNRANGGAKTNGPMKAVGNNGLRNKRSVWTLPTQPFKGAHFATFPVKLVQPCVLAGTSEKGCCPQCRAPWRKIIKKGYRAPSDEKVIAEMIANGVPRQKANLYGNPTRAPALYAANPDQVIGWKPTCRCGSQETVPCTILDPFAGSGTTAQVALALQRHAILIELNPDYQPLIQARTQPLAGEVQGVLL